MKDIFWVDEAVDNAINLLREHGIEMGAKGQDLMREALNRAYITQRFITSGSDKPATVYDASGLKVGDWVKDKDNEWLLVSILYD